MSIFEISEVKSKKEFEKYLDDIISDKTEREKLYDKITLDDSIDLFRDYFEENNAERKTNKQDYTPTNVAELMATLAGSKAHNFYDGAAGTGTLIIAAWVKAGKPKDFFAYAWEYSDSVIPYLIHNLAFRNISAEIVNGDTLTQEVFARYELKQSEKYSEVIRCDID